MIIIKVGNEMKDMAMKNEIVQTYCEDHGLTIEDEMVFDIANKIHTDLLDIIELEIGFDFGWQKRASGHRYDSLSGHGFFIGLRTNKIISYVCYSKHCYICGYSKSSKVREHPCPKNYEGKSSKVWNRTEL